MVYVYDNFLPNFEEYSNLVRISQFGDVISQGITYRDVSQEVSSQDLYQELAKLGWKTTDVVSFLRAYLNRSEYRHPMWIHSDALFSEWAGIFFIQSTEFTQDDGLAFWENKELASNEILPRDPCFEYKSTLVDTSSLDPEKWNLWKRVEFKPNRLVIFPSTFFHSKMTYGNVGDKIDNCRLVHVLFFNRDRS